MHRAEQPLDPAQFLDVHFVQHFAGYTGRGEEPVHPPPASLFRFAGLDVIYSDIGEQPKYPATATAHDVGLAGFALGRPATLLIFEGVDKPLQLAVRQFRRALHAVAGKDIRLAVADTELAQQCVEIFVCLVSVHNCYFLGKHLSICIPARRKIRAWLWFPARSASSAICRTAVIISPASSSVSSCRAMPVSVLRVFMFNLPKHSDSPTAPETGGRGRLSYRIFPALSNSDYPILQSVAVS